MIFSRSTLHWSVWYAKPFVNWSPIGFATTPGNSVSIATYLGGRAGLVVRRRGGAAARRAHPVEQPLTRLE